MRVYRYLYKTQGEKSDLDVIQHEVKNPCI